MMISSTNVMRMPSRRGQAAECTLHSRRVITAFALFALAIVPCGGGLAQVPVEIDIRLTENGVVVIGLSTEAIANLENTSDRQVRLAESLKVYVASVTSDDQPPILGHYRVRDGRLLFTPRFPFKPGVAYRAVFSPPARSVASEARPPHENVIERVFRLPKTTPSQPTVVQAVYPSSDMLPENQLKFYVHFSAPMTQGDSYRHIRLLDAVGQKVDLPFVELAHELWDRSGTRITLLFDPGRIKRGLRPREELGPILREGQSYTLVIGHSWNDANGNPLAAEARKRFNVVAPDDTQPEPSKWHVNVPSPNTKMPLQIDFDEPLDHAMLLRVLVVLDSDGTSLDGRIRVANHEQGWLFFPESKWRTGRYTVCVDTTLEDLAGNSIGRPFEVDVFRKVEVTTKRETISIPFRVL